MTRKSLKSQKKRVQRSAHKNNSWIPDLTLPGYNYLGPGNELNKGNPTNKSDSTAQGHDYGYDDLIDQGINPYLTWNTADEQAQGNWGNDWGGILAKSFFNVKKFTMAPFDPLSLTYKDPIGTPSHVTTSEPPGTDPYVAPLKKSKPTSNITPGNNKSEMIHKKTRRMIPITPDRDPTSCKSFFNLLCRTQLKLLKLQMRKLLC
jgi:Phospholipase A2-like domain